MNVIGRGLRMRNLARLVRKHEIDVTQFFRRFGMTELWKMPSERYEEAVRFLEAGGRDAEEAVRDGT